MPKKAAKGKLDVAQRTLFQYDAFKQPQGVASSPSKTTDASLLKRAKSTSNAPHSTSSALPREQEASNHSRELPYEPAQLPQTSSVLGPVGFRSIAEVELQKAMAKLNGEQKAAVAAPLSSPIAVFAGAGTGKTTALIARIWNMLKQGIKPECILAITFTRKACQEIKDRLMVEQLGCKVPVSVFTFHGWAIRFLRMKQIREMAGIPQKLVIWAQREQKEHMAQACQRARVDHDLLPQARRLMGMPVTGQLSPDDSWKELLRKAFTDPSIRDGMLSAKQRAKDRVQAALKEVASLQKDVDCDDDVAGNRDTSAALTDQQRHDAGAANASPGKQMQPSITQQYGSLSGPAAAPGASTLPSAKMHHVRATARVLAPANGHLSETDAEEEEVGNEYLKSDLRSGRGHWVDELFPDGSIDTWTVVAKELLTTYCRQECGIEIIILKQGSDNGVASANERRLRTMRHRTYFLFHKAPADGAPAHATKLDQQALTSKDSSANFRPVQGLEPETFQTIANQYYDARMKLLGALDFDEMLAKAEHLLGSSAEARGIARNMYQHLLVDEFQDSNAVQIRIVKHLQDGRGHLTVVGDDAQSIYGFRGATNRAFVLLSEILEDSPLTEYSMTQNYRSLSPIIEVGNYVLQHLMSNGALTQKDLTCTRTGETLPVQYHELGTGLDEARFIVEEIQQLHGKGIKYDDMAIICRLNNSKMLFPHEFGVLHHIKMQLAKAAIPHRVFRGRQMTDKPEYILTLEVLKFLTNPLNDGALLAILESKLLMKAGIGESVINQLKRIVRDANQPVPVWHSLQDLVRRPDTATRKRNAVKRLLDWHKRVYGEVMFKALPDALLYVWMESGISALAAKNRKNAATSPTKDDPFRSNVSGYSNQPDMTLSKQNSVCMSQHSGLSVADVTRSPVSKRKAANCTASDTTAEMILTSPTLEALFKNSGEFLAEWTGEALFLERFGELRLTSASAEHPRTPPSLLSLATAAVMQLPQAHRVDAVNSLAMANPGLADLILSVNKCGYGPVAEFVQHLDLNSSEVAEEADAQDQKADGKVTLSTVHGCKGAVSGLPGLTPGMRAVVILSACAGLEWPVVFVPKFIENVMPLKFFSKRAIPIDSHEGANSEDMAIAAVQADARMRGKLLKAHDDVVAYLPEWLRQDGLEPETGMDSGSDSDSRFDLRPCGHVDPEQVSTCYKRKKEKQHDEEEIRLAHVAFTRAKDRLYVTSHRIAEGTADATSVEAVKASKTGAVTRVYPSQSIPLLNNSTVVSRTCHPINDVEAYLDLCAEQNEMQQGGWRRNIGSRAQLATWAQPRIEGQVSQGVAQPVSAAVAVAQAAVQGANENAASGFQFMGAASSGRQGSNAGARRATAFAQGLHGLHAGSSRGLADSQSQCPVEAVHARDSSLGRSSLPGRAISLSDSDDEPPLPMWKRIATGSVADASSRRLPQNMGSTSKPKSPSRHGRERVDGAMGSGSPVALTQAVVSGRSTVAREDVQDGAAGPSGDCHPSASNGQDLLIDLTSPRAMGRNASSHIARESSGKIGADRLPGCKAPSIARALPRIRPGRSGQPNGTQFRPPRRNA